MRWPWKRRTDADERGLEEARRNLARVRAQWPDAHEQAKAVRRHKQRNNFGPNLELIYASRRKS